MLGCHANPDRCLSVADRRLPICARCTGLIAGNLAAAPLLVAVGAPPIALGLAALVPMAVDGTRQALGTYRSTNARRLVTGLLAGAGQLSILVTLARALLPA